MAWNHDRVASRNQTPTSKEALKHSQWSPARFAGLGPRARPPKARCRETIHHSILRETSERANAADHYTVPFCEPLQWAG